MAIPLPYPEYTWSISQHTRRISNEPKIMFSLLRGRLFTAEKPITRTRSLTTSYGRI